MQREVTNQGHHAAQNNSRRKHHPYQRNTHKKDQHAASGEKSAGKASADYDLRHIDLKRCCIVCHVLPSTASITDWGVGFTRGWLD